MSQTILITGSTRGLGKAIALKFAHAKATVILHGTKASTTATATYRAVTKLSPGSSIIYFDLTQPQTIKAQINQLFAQHPHLDILINNAGITRDKTLINMTNTDWDQVINTNLTGTFHVTQSVLPQMIKQHSGRIINLSSVVARTGNFGQTNYAAAKAGLIGFTKSLALEVAKHNITVNAICPGFIQTGLTKTIPRRYLDQITPKIPLGRLAQPEEIASVIFSLAQPENSYMTGSVIDINGGLG